MNVQIKELIIWSKKEGLAPRRIPFEAGKVNVIYGRSQSGKSAIINIIDYCFCSSENKIPTGIVRDNSSWFGIKISINDGEALLARENLSGKNFNFYFKEGKNIDIPQNPEGMYKSFDEIKKILNDRFGLPFTEKSNNPLKNRLSFRDMISFNFQPQFIIANPNCLFYKTDISKYRDRLKNILDVALSIEDIDNYINRKEYENLEDILKKEKEKKEKLLEEDSAHLHSFLPVILNAQYLGLLPSDIDFYNASSVDIKDALKNLAQKQISDIELKSNMDNKIQNRLNALNKNLQQSYDELKDLEIKNKNLSYFINLQSNFDRLNNEKRERLCLSEFVKKFYKKYRLDIIAENQIEKLYENLRKIEIESSRYQGAFSRAKSNIIELNKRIIEKREEINNILYEYNEIKKENRNISAWEELYSSIACAKNYILEFNKEIEKTNENILKIEAKMKDLKFVKHSINAILIKICSYINKYLLDFTEFKKIDCFDAENLTIKVRNENDESCFLYETGSASNWLSYHIATLLSFHRYFSEHNSPVFNFLILDQPTQVFFPNGFPENNTLQTDATDEKNVIEIFKLLNEYVLEMKGNVQIIVLDHAKPDIWGRFSNIFPFQENWHDSSKALIPIEWYQSESVTLSEEY